MKIAITKGLNEQESDEMRQAFAHAVYLRKRVIKLLNEKITVNNKATRTKDAYGIANWAFLQADAVGYERAMQEVIGLLTYEKTDAVEEPAQGDDTIPTVRKRGRPKAASTSA